jgi:hypothetical protein
MSFKTIVLEKKLTEISPSYSHAIGTKTKPFYRSWMLLTTLKTTRQGQGKGAIYFFLFISFKAVRTSYCRNKLRMWEFVLSVTRSEGFSQGILQFFMLFVN